MTENKSTKSTFSLPAPITSAVNTWATNTVKRELSAKVADAKMAQTIEANYPESLTKATRSGLSGAVKALVAARKVVSDGQTFLPTASDATRASKFVTTAWLRVGLKRSDVDPDTLPRLTVGTGEEAKTFDAIRLVVNGEGGSDLAPFRKAILGAAEAGKFGDIPGLIAGYKPVAKVETSSAGSDDENEAEVPPVVVGASVDAATLTALLNRIAETVAASAVDYSPEESERLGDALSALDTAIGTRVKAPVAA